MQKTDYVGNIGNISDITMSRIYGTNHGFWKVEKRSLIILIIGLILSINLYPSLILGVSGLLFIIKLPRLKLVIDKEHLLLLATFVSIISINVVIYYKTLYWSAHLCLTPLFLYSLGRYYTRRWQNEDNFLLLMLLLAVSLGSTHIYITMIDIVKIGIVNPQRSLTILENEEIQRSTTQRTIELSLCSFGLSIIFFKPHNSFQKSAKGFFIVLGLLALLCYVHYISRTGLVLSVVALLLGGLQAKKGNLRFILIIIIIVLFSVLLFNQTESFEVYELYRNRNTFDTSFWEAGGRKRRWGMAIIDILQYPWGRKTSNYFAHNMWLDIGLQFGIIPFVCFVLFSVSNLKKAILIVVRKREGSLVRLCVISFYTLFFFSCFTEPIHLGAANYMFVYLMFCGMIDSIYKRRLQIT